MNGFGRVAGVSFGQGPTLRFFAKWEPAKWGPANWSEPEFLRKANFVIDYSLVNNQ